MAILVPKLSFGTRIAISDYYGAQEMRSSNQPFELDSS